MIPRPLADWLAVAVICAMVWVGYPWLMNTLPWAVAVERTRGPAVYVVER